MSALGGVLRHAQPFHLGLRSSRVLGHAAPTTSTSVGFATSAESKLGLNKPKKPIPAFFKFLNQVRPTLMTKNPGIGTIEIAKLASKHWEQLNEDTKTKIMKEYEKELEEYKKKKAVFVNSLTKEQKENITKLKEEMAEAKEKRRIKAELKDLGRPKRPVTSYILFMQSEMDKLKTKSITESASVISQKWKSISPQEKAGYEKKAKELLDIYNKEMAQWEQKMIRMGNIDYVRNKALMPTDKSKKPHSE